jgi:hypothetical protein
MSPAPPGIVSREEKGASENVQDAAHGNNRMAVPRARRARQLISLPLTMGELRASGAESLALI